MQLSNGFKISLMLPFFLSLVWISPADAASFQGLGWLEGGDYGQVTSISDNGAVVVGGSRSSSGFQAFRWTAGDGMVGLGPLPGLESSKASCVSGNGDVIVGHSYTLNSSLWHAFRWTVDGGMVDIGGLDSVAKGVSDDGSVVVGYGRTTAREAFRWTRDEGMVGLGFLPGPYHASYALAVSGNSSVIVGEARNANRDLEAFRWTAEVGMMGLGDLEGGHFESYATAVSDDGTVVVGRSASHEFSPSGWEAFRWTPDEGMVGLGYLPGASYSFANTISADGSIIVGGGDGEGAFLWNSQDGMVCIKDLLETRYGLNLTDWTIIEAVGISDDGLTTVGHGVNPDGEWQGWMAVISEPVLIVEIDIEPHTLNLSNKGKWITCYIWLPEDYNVTDVNSYSVFLDDEIKAEWIWADEEEQVVMAKFSRSALQEMLAGWDELGEVELLVTGELVDGTRFEGTDTIKVINKGNKK